MLAPETVTSGPSPVITSSQAAVTAPSIIGNDNSGDLAFTVGVGDVGGAQVLVTFSTPFPAGHQLAVVLFPQSGAAAAAVTLITAVVNYVAGAAVSFNVSSSAAIPPAALYSYHYMAF